MGRERIAFNFRELLKSFFGNGEEYKKDDEIEIEVSKIEEAEDGDLIHRLEEATTSSGNKAGGKKGNRIKVEAPEVETAEIPLEEKERDEER